MDLEQKVKQYEKLHKQIQELEEEKKALSQAILQEMQSERTLHISNYIVRRYSRLAIHPSLDTARALDAIKTLEAVDKDKIKVLYEQGKPVEGVSEIHYIRIFQNATSPSSSAA